MEARGATVFTAAIDVADEAQMGQLFDHLRATFPPLRGVIHAAGVVSTLTTVDADLADLRATFRPKVGGALVLDRLSQSLPLDFFVCFSSAASIWGAKECSYSAANAVLDAFAHQRFADLLLKAFETVVLRVLPFELRQMLIVVGAHLFISRFDAGKEPLIDEAQDSELP